MDGQPGQKGDIGPPGPISFADPSNSTNCGCPPLSLDDPIVQNITRSLKGERGRRGKSGSPGPIGPPGLSIVGDVGYPGYPVSFKLKLGFITFSKH